MKMVHDSLEQTLVKLRERVAFLERANQSLAADRKRVMDEFARCEEILGGLGGLSLSGALANRMTREEKREERRKPTRDRQQWELMASNFPDTGLIGDDA